MGLEFDYKDGQTPLDEEEKEGLKIKSITTQGELDEFEQLNIEKAVEWTIHSKFKLEKFLTEKLVKGLHKRMYGDVWKWAGEFRKIEKNIGIPWTEEIAIRFKHRIVSIHCFPNGNGRHSRMMADIIMESIFGNKIFSWHQSNMVKANETRNQYIKALREADNGNFKQLIEFAKN